MRPLLLSIAAFALIGAAPSPDIPLVAIGLPFAPEKPMPVARDHPLYHRVAVGDVEGITAIVRFKAAPPGRLHKGLRETLDRMNLLAPSDGEARVRLVATWQGLDSPASLLVASKETTATLHYQLVRIDNHQVLLDRTIATTVKGEGSALDGGMGMARAAIAANFASAAACMDKAAYGRAPDDCALQPLYGVSVSRRH
ncbi:hypothetical protein EBBID32_44320 [Sphingobium indicum BiD32]|uniref:FHA domain-containing protein n=1 Tax=Sphingobium indicum BiD32 TaxID=1301087 RepID=N1MSV1_9SPHN|nr:hypothetical protein [Sphingobium indicum]CCW20061.1 hypothetical protein EBBID32_44320 [Sphingobium indicum BiD32]